MIVTIDGPAGAGKSTVARALAQRLGFRFLDTGAMYRAVALAALRQRIDWHDPQALAELAPTLAIDVTEERVLLNGEDVTAAIRTVEVTKVTRYAADHPRVREHLVHLQQQIGEQASLVTEGRDQGTVVFPQAECKIFLTASPEQRARRRWQDLQDRGEALSFDEVLAQQNLRDQQDETRPTGRLYAAADAVEVNTDGLSKSDVVDRLEQIARSRMGYRGPQ